MSRQMKKTVIPSQVVADDGGPEVRAPVFMKGKEQEEPGWKGRGFRDGRRS